MVFPADDKKKDLLKARQIIAHLETKYQGCITRKSRQSINITLKTLAIHLILQYTKLTKLEIQQVVKMKYNNVLEIRMNLNEWSKQFPYLKTIIIEEETFFE